VLQDYGTESSEVDALGREGDELIVEEEKACHRHLLSLERFGGKITLSNANKSPNNTKVAQDHTHLISIPQSASLLSPTDQPAPAPDSLTYPSQSHS
jgi:hypothetical protein